MTLHRHDVCANCGHQRYHHEPECDHKTRAWNIPPCSCPAFVEPDATETIVIW